MVLRTSGWYTPKFLQSIMNEVNDYAINTMLLRMMAKAKYDVYNIGHYGLASQCYTHFTSPIRRYPDLLVHRLLKKYLINNEVSVEDQKKTFDMIALRAEQSSKKERDAIECEYEVNDMKMAEYMENHIGEEFEGTISSVNNSVISLFSCTWRNAKKDIPPVIIINKMMTIIRILLLSMALYLIISRKSTTFCVFTQKITKFFFFKSE